MAIKNLEDKISNSDVDKVKNIMNHSEYEDGYEPDDSDGGLFGDMDSFEISEDDLGSSLGFSSSGGFNSFNSDGGFGTSTAFGGGVSTGFGTSALGNNNEQQVQKEDGLDRIMNFSGEGLVSLGKILIHMVKTIPSRTYDDLGYYGRNMIMTALALLGSGILLAIFGQITQLSALRFGALPVQLIISSLLTLSTGLAGMGAAALLIVKSNDSEDEISNVSTIQPITDSSEFSIQDDDDQLDYLVSNLFNDEPLSDDFDCEEEDEEDIDINSIDFIGKDNNEEFNREDTSFEDMLTNVPAKVPMLTREFLFNTFVPFLPFNTLDFAKRERMDSDSKEFYNLATIIFQALASANKCEIEDIDCNIDRIIETYFTYEIFVKRIRGLNKLDEIEKEVTAYLRESSDDLSVSTTVDLEGSFYKIKVNKGISAVVTMGDALKLQEVKEFFLNTKKAMPCIAGINESGVPLLIDAKDYDTMLIAGKPRSGKSWYVFSILMSIMIFNPPDLAQFLIIDPKESNAFKTIALMPHVCGLHNDDHIIEILADVIEKEAKRRKKLLSDNRCETIWELRGDKNILVPILYIVIDEVMTVLSNIGTRKDNLIEQWKIIISQLPSLGIRLIMVPHRSQGVVDKTVRSLISFSAAVRADDDIVKETLGITKWNKPLINPGDTAVKIQGMGKEQFIRGAALTTSDKSNTELITNIARAYYKMGVEIPDMTTIGYGYNRDEQYIQDELSIEGRNVIQYDVEEEIKDKSLEDLINEG